MIQFRTHQSYHLLDYELYAELQYFCKLHPVQKLDWLNYTWSAVDASRGKIVLHSLHSSPDFDIVRLHSSCRVCRGSLDYFVQSLFTPHIDVLQLNKVCAVCNTSIEYFSQSSFTVDRNQFLLTLFSAVYIAVLDYFPNHNCSAVQRQFHIFHSAFALFLTQCIEHRAKPVSQHSFCILYTVFPVCTPPNSEFPLTISYVHSKIILLMHIYSMNTLHKLHVSKITKVD